MTEPRYIETRRIVGIFDSQFQTRYLILTRRIVAMVVIDSMRVYTSNYTDLPCLTTGVITQP